MLTHRFLICLCLIGLIANVTSAQLDSPDDLKVNKPGQKKFVTVHSGDLPIILSSPHGGSSSIPNVPARKGTNVPRFKAMSDAYTAQLTVKLANMIEDQLGKRPYVVIARFHRRYVDANRPKSGAYEVEAAKAAYDSYHAALTKARKDVTKRWGHGLLLDIHGQASEPTAIIRGTQNGQTTKHLVSKFGQESLIGSKSLFGQFAQQGFSVLPPVGSNSKEIPGYSGGYIVGTHGSRNGGTVDAIQLELGRELRDPAVNGVTAESLARAITAYAKVYLPDVGRGITRRSVFADDFSDGKRDGWFEIDDDSSTLSVKTKTGQLGRLPELNFTAASSGDTASNVETDSVKAIATHFPTVDLRKTGDFVSVRFNARHNHDGFLNRGFRFGLFDSNDTTFRKDGDLDTKPISVDDRGYFALLDLGRSTTQGAALIRETNNTSDQRLWNGRTIASDKNGSAPNPLMFQRDTSCIYTFTLKRREDGKVDIVLKNAVSGDADALRATSTLKPTLKVDSLYFGTNNSTADFAIDNVVVSNHRTTVASIPRTKVGVYCDKGAGASVNNLIRTISRFEDVEVTRLKANDIRSSMLSRLDLLIQPGGSGSGQGRHLGEDGRNRIREFVDNGGGYIGICAGAYLASAHYSWSLDILDAKVLDTKHWNRGKGSVQIALTESGKDTLQVKNEKLTIRYAQGPLLAPGEQADINDYEEMATFETEIAKNGAPTGVMKGTTAIAKGEYGQGRVICFSPHPEMTDGLEDMVRFAIEHVKRNKKR